MGQAAQAGARRVAANVPGAHMRQSAASTPPLAQPAGQATQAGARPGGRGQPAARGARAVSGLSARWRRQQAAG